MSSGTWRLGLGGTGGVVTRRVLVGSAVGEASNNPLLLTGANLANSALLLLDPASFTAGVAVLGANHVTSFNSDGLFFLAIDVGNDSLLSVFA